MTALFHVPVQETSTDERFTPAWVFDALGETFDLDPCSPIGLETFVPATRRLTREDDGLTAPWQGFVFVNPPYSNSTPWADRFLAHDEGGSGSGHSRTPRGSTGCSAAARWSG